MENHTHGVYGNRGIAVCPCPSVSYGVLGILCVGESLFGLDDLAELGFPFPLLEGWRSDTCARGGVEAEGLGLLGGASCASADGCAILRGLHGQGVPTHAPRGTGRVRDWGVRGRSVLDDDDFAESALVIDLLYLAV